MPSRGAALCLPLLFAALTGRSGHGLARMDRIRLPTRSASYRRPRAAALARCSSRILCCSISSRRARKRSTRRGSISPLSVAAVTAQSGSAPWAQSENRQLRPMLLDVAEHAAQRLLRVDQAKGAHARRVEHHAAVAGQEHEPAGHRGVPAPPVGRPDLPRWRQPQHGPGRSPGSTFPTRWHPRGPWFDPEPSRDRSSSRPRPRRALKVRTSTSPATARTVSAAAAASGARSALVSKYHDGGLAVTSHHQHALEASRRQGPIEAGDDARNVEVGRQHLLGVAFGGIAAGQGREPGQHPADKHHLVSGLSPAPSLR